MSPVPCKLSVQGLRVVTVMSWKAAEAFPTSLQSCWSVIHLSLSGFPQFESVHIQGFKGKHVEIKLVWWLMRKSYNCRIGKMSRRQRCMKDLELRWNRRSWFCHLVTLNKLLNSATYR